MRVLLLSLLLAIAVSEGAGQIKKPTKPTSVAQPPRLIFTPRQTTLSVSLGFSPPVSHDGLTTYWKTGPGGSVRLLFSFSQYLKVGFGSDLSLFYIRKAVFQSPAPGLTRRAEDASLWSTYIAIRVYARPTLRFSPFIEGDFGFSRITPSKYQLLVNSVPVAYYDLPGATHLSVGLVGGFDYYLSRKVAIEIDAKGTYVYGSAEVGLIVFVSGGLKFTL